MNVAKSMAAVASSMVAGKRSRSSSVMGRREAMLVDVRRVVAEVVGDGRQAQRESDDDEQRQAEREAVVARPGAPSAACERHDVGPASDDRPDTQKREAGDGQDRRRRQDADAGAREAREHRDEDERR